MNLVLAFLFLFLFNIPFGYWRANVKKFSLQWMLAIHLPVPFVVAYRIFSNLGWEFITYPVLIGAFFFGQLMGSFLFQLMKKQFGFELSSCLIMDLTKLQGNKSPD